MAEFMKGLDLCEQFFKEIAQPILEKRFTNLKYSAGLLGYGSDVLGYDDATSTDHMWGPRFYLFLDKESVDLKGQIEEVFSNELPYSFKGFSVHFGEPNINDNGVRLAKFITSGKVSPLIFLYTIDDFITEYLGKSDLENIDDYDWLTFSEHRLLTLTSGRWFVDMLGAKDILRHLTFYPNDIKLYLLASNWSIIAEEQAFIKRCGECKDEIGSRIICARISDRLMRLCFLYSNKYAPYSKWFGTAFNDLPIDKEIGANIHKALSADTLNDRENYIVQAQTLVATLHNSCKITEHIEVEVQRYHRRDIKVIFADKFADAIIDKLQGTKFEHMPLIGTLSQIGNYSVITDRIFYNKKVKALYSK